MTDALLCGSYRPGHQPHYIQARKAAEDRDNLPLHGVVVAVELNGIVVVRLPDGERRFWNHDPQRLKDIVGVGRRVRYQERWGLLLHGSFGHRYLFSLGQPSEPPEVPCRPAPLAKLFP